MNDQDKCVILAPHVDDETIGCFRLLNDRKVGKVIYFNEVTDERWQEALNAATFFGFEAVKASDLDMNHARLSLMSSSTVVWVPSSYDQHPDHKAVNALFRSVPTARFYSVSMNVPRYDVLDANTRQLKKRVLQTLYPSQASLFADDRYHLFESNVELDGVFSREYSWTGHGVTIEIEAYGEKPELSIHDTHVFRYGALNVVEIANYWKTAYPRYGVRATVNNESFYIPI